MSFNPTNWLAALLVGLSPLPPKSDPNKPAVILVHGIYDSGEKMLWLAHRFELAGYETFCPSIIPSNGDLTIVDAATQLDEKVLARFGNSRPLHVVGFSMGGLIARQWLVKFPVRQRVVSFATLSAPHHGTAFANINQKPGVQDMRPGSNFLTNLATGVSLLATLHPLSIYTPLDLIILPASSSEWSIATNQKHWALFHPWMVFSPTVAARLLQYMGERESISE